MFSFLHVEALRYYPIAGSALLEFTMAKFPELHFDSKTTSRVGSFQEWHTTLYLPPNHRRHFLFLTKIDLIHRKTDLTRVKRNRKLIKTCERPVRSVRSQQLRHEQKTAAKSARTASRRRGARSRVGLRGAVSPPQRSTGAPLLCSSVVPRSGTSSGAGARLRVETLAAAASHAPSSWRVTLTEKENRIEKNGTVPQSAARAWFSWTVWREAFAPAEAESWRSWRDVSPSLNQRQGLVCQEGSPQGLLVPAHGETCLATHTPQRRQVLELFSPITIVRKWVFFHFLLAFDLPPAAIPRALCCSRRVEKEALGACVRS